MLRMALHPRLRRERTSVWTPARARAILAALLEPPMPLDPAVAAELAAVSTATLTTVLLKKGLRRVAMRGPRPFGAASSGRIVGRAFTMRFVPAREDLATPESWASPRSTRAAIEAMAPGDIAVVDAMGVTTAG